MLLVTQQQMLLAASGKDGVGEAATAAVGGF